MASRSRHTWSVSGGRQSTLVHSIAVPAPTGWTIYLGPGCHTQHPQCLITPAGSTRRGGIVVPYQLGSSHFLVTTI